MSRVQFRCPVNRPVSLGAGHRALSRHPRPLRTQHEHDGASSGQQRRPCAFVVAQGGFQRVLRQCRDLYPDGVFGRGRRSGILEVDAAPALGRRTILAGLLFRRELRIILAPPAVGDAGRACSDCVVRVSIDPAGTSGPALSNLSRIGWAPKTLVAIGSVQPVQPERNNTCARVRAGMRKHVRARAGAGKYLLQGWSWFFAQKSPWLGLFSRPTLRFQRLDVNRSAPRAVPGGSGPGVLEVAVGADGARSWRIGDGVRCEQVGLAHVLSEDSSGSVGLPQDYGARSASSFVQRHDAFRVYFAEQTDLAHSHPERGLVLAAE